MGGRAAVPGLANTGPCTALFRVQPMQICLDPILLTSPPEVRKEARAHHSAAHSAEWVDGWVAVRGTHETYWGESVQPPTGCHSPLPTQDDPA